MSFYKNFLIGLATTIIPFFCFANVSYGFDFPVGKPDAVNYYNAQAFGVANKDFGDKYHLGEDWNGNRRGDSDYNDPVYSISQGEIVLANKNRKGWGGVVVIKHMLPDNTAIYSFYGHLVNIKKTSGSVEKGEIIAGIGKGDKNQFSAHLHFEIRDDNNPLKSEPGPGYSYNTKGWINPTQFINEHRQILTPPMAVDLAVSETTYNSAKLSWTKNESTHFKSYQLFKSQASPVSKNSELVFETQNEELLFYEDKDLLPKTEYFYVLYVCNQADQCTSSKEVSIKTEKDPNDIGQIVFVSVVNNLRQIFTIISQKENIKQVRTSNYNDGNPKWSPDGQKILFDSIDPQTIKRQVFMMNKNGSAEQKITNAKYSAEQADWLPNGQEIIYRGNDTQGLGLYVKTIGQNNERILTPLHIIPYNPSVSSDGLLVFYKATYKDPKTTGGLFVTEIASGETIQLNQSNLDFNFDVSPTDPVVVFVSSEYSRNNQFLDVCFISLPEANRKTMSCMTQKDNTDSNLYPSFSNDGQKLIYSSRKKDEGDYEIYLYSGFGEEILILTNNDTDDLMPDIWIEP